MTTASPRGRRRATERGHTARAGNPAGGIGREAGGRAKAVRFTTLEALCEVLECQPGDLLRWEPEE